jgi:hypothetical protein
MARMSLFQGRQMIKQMSRQQPAVLAYLLAAGGDFLSGDEQELLLYVGVVVWQIMLQGNAPLPEVTEKTLDEQKEKI